MQAEPIFKLPETFTKETNKLISTKTSKLNGKVYRILKQKNLLPELKICLLNCNIFSEIKPYQKKIIAILTNTYFEDTLMNSAKVEIQIDSTKKMMCVRIIGVVIFVAMGIFEILGPGSRNYNILPAVYFLLTALVDFRNMKKDQQLLNDCKGWVSKLDTLFSKENCAKYKKYLESTGTNKQILDASLRSLMEIEKALQET